jgi:hypothetical protein
MECFASIDYNFLSSIQRKVLQTNKEKHQDFYCSNATLSGQVCVQVNLEARHDWKIRLKRKKLMQENSELRCLSSDSFVSSAFGVKNLKLIEK